jgi:hypothetical protein
MFRSVFHPDLIGLPFPVVVLHHAGDGHVYAGGVPSGDYLVYHAVEEHVACFALGVLRMRQ